MSPYEAEAMSRAVISDRVREADHRRLVREIRQSEPPSRAGAAASAASAGRPSRLWRLVHLSHAFG